MKKNIKEINSLREIRYSDLQNFRDLIDLSAEQPNQEEFLSYTILRIFYDISTEEARQLDPAKFESLISSLGVALQEEIKFENLIFMKGITYGLIPDFSKITAGELIDMDALLKNNDIIQLMSILYRPVIGSVNDRGEYRIEDYSEYDYKFENIDAYIVESAMSFFTRSFHQLKQISI